MGLKLPDAFVKLGGSFMLYGVTPWGWGLDCCHGERSVLLGPVT